MSSTKTKLIKKVENVATFLAERIARQSELNRKVDTLLSKLKKEAEDHKETVLFSIPLKRTVVSLNKQVRENFFRGLYYPEVGLLLNEIEIVHIEHIADMGFRYSRKINVRFKFSNENFNNHFNYFPLSKVSFDDEKKKISEQSMGLCLDPTFVSMDKYLRVKECLLFVIQKINEQKE